jgi:NAD(P)H dehydrogenase (quinone)
VRQIVRDAARAPVLDGVETIVASGLDDRATLLSAMGPGDRVFMVSAWTDHDERMRLHRAFVDAAADAEIGHLVYLSFVQAAPDAAFSHAVSHHETEEHIRAAGLPFTFLRTSYYQFCLAAFFIDGIVRGPRGRVGWVAREDVAAAVAAAMAGDAETGSVYDVTGPAAPTLAESAEHVGRLLGRDFAWVEDTQPVAGAPEWKEGIRLRGSRAVELGQLDTVGDGVRRLTGREATPIDDYVRAHADLFTADAAP